MLQKKFDDYQIIIVTHDDRFFSLLQDHLSPSKWLFRRILRIEPDRGPVLHDHRTPDEVIEEKLEQGESAANEIRQAEEDWLLDLCRAFRVKVTIRQLDRPYKYDRSELAGALASFLKGAKILPPEVPGIANSFLTSLQKGDVENFGSHFSDDPNAWKAIGDEKSRWREFKYFRDLFVCGDCGGRRFIRPDQLTKPVCKKCEKTLDFSLPKKVA